MARSRNKTKAEQGNAPTPTPATPAAGAAVPPAGVPQTLGNTPVEEVPETPGGLTEAAANAAPAPTEHLGDSDGVALEKQRQAEVAKQLAEREAAVAAREAAVANGEPPQTLPPVPPAPEEAVVERYRVLVDRTINLKGNRAKLNAGKVISSLEYPIKHLRNQGVTLELLKDGDH